VNALRPNSYGLQKAAVFLSADLLNPNLLHRVALALPTGPGTRTKAAVLLISLLKVSLPLSAAMDGAGPAPPTAVARPVDRQPLLLPASLLPPLAPAEAPLLPRSKASVIIVALSTFAPRAWLRALYPV